MDINELNEHERTMNQEQIPSYLQFSINLEPFIQLQIENEREFYQGHEKTQLLHEGNLWIKRFAAKFPNKPRTMKVFLENLDGESVFISKFLHPIEPPAELLAQAGS
jgi:hypothetical protein